MLCSLSYGESDLLGGVASSQDTGQELDDTDLGETRESESESDNGEEPSDEEMEEEGEYGSL